MNYRRACDIFPVDLGVDLRPFQAEITKCKRRFQQDLWNTICTRVLESQSSWKKEGSEATKSDRSLGERASEGEAREEDEGDAREGGYEEGDYEEGKAEESGENENNASRMYRMQRRGGRGNGSNNIGRGRNVVLKGPQQVVARQPHKAVPLSRPQPLQMSMHRRFVGKQQQQQQEQRFFRGELSHFVHEMQPQEGLDWRSGGSRVRNSSNAYRPRQHQQLLQNQHIRSYSATSKREILGCYDPADEEAMEDSEACEGAQVFGGSNTGYCSDGDTVTHRVHNSDSTVGQTDAATNSTVSKEFVPLLVGSWK